jgi:perosamine synthetase
MSPRIFLDKPNLGPAEKRSLARAIDDGYVSTVGPFVGKFEEGFARVLGAPRAVATQSGTAALQMALHEAGIGAGHEVIVPVLTFVASVNPILHAGARPVFVDVDPTTWTMDPHETARAVTRRTRGIMPVHLFGNPCDMAPILELAQRKGLTVIEDATESLGAFYRGRATGTLGDFGCFSFNGNKVITTGGGGMIVGKKLSRLNHIKFLVNQGRDDREGFYHSEAGFNYRMTNLEASLGLAQVGRLPEFLAKKRRFLEIYQSALSDKSTVRFQVEPSGGKSSWWMTAIRWSGGRMNVLRKALAKEGIPTRGLFTPVNRFPFLARYARRSFPVADRLFSEGVCLPSSTVNTARDVQRVASVLEKLL